MRLVYSSSRTGNQYTEEILWVHPGCVIEIKEGIKDQLLGDTLGWLYIAQVGTFVSVLVIQVVTIVAVVVIVVVERVVVEAGAN